MIPICKVAILIDGGFFLRRFKVLNQRSPRITDVQSFLDEVMQKIQTLTSKGYLGFPSQGSRLQHYQIQ